MQMVSYIPFKELFWLVTPCRECQEKVEFLTVEEVVSSHFDKVTLASTAHERKTLLTLVSYEHNVAAKYGSSKLLTTNCDY